jgi:hypothetical protein
MLELIGLAFSTKFNNHEDVLVMIDKSTEVLKDCLIYADFSETQIDFPFDNVMDLEFNENLDIIAWDEPNEQSDDWDQKDRGKYRLNKKYENIVPMMPTGSKMTIYTM